MAELGISVRISAGTIFLNGDVATAERKAAIGEVVSAMAEGRELHNGLTVAVLAEADTEETIP